MQIKNIDPCGKTLGYIEELVRRGGDGVFSAVTVIQPLLGVKYIVDIWDEKV